MTTTISSESVWKKKEIIRYTKIKGGQFDRVSHRADVRQTSRQNIYRIDAYIWEECALKKSDLYLQLGPRKNHVSHKTLQTDEHL